jgi:hypothetical protein
MEAETINAPVIAAIRFTDFPPKWFDSTVTATRG